MSVASATNSAAASATGSSSNSLDNFNAQIGYQEFFQLLVAQLQNQDPSQPMSSTDFINELAQLSSLSGIEQVNTNLTTLSSQQMLTGGTSLIGQAVSYTNPTNNTTSSGTIQAVNDISGTANVIINDQTVPVANILNVQ
jgi:flagellar basal-body rod modification protein FlgD